MPFVLDASTALAHLLPDEASDRADLAFDELKTDRAIVPALWPFEVANGLLMAERRRRITTEIATRLALDLAALPIDVEPQTSQALAAIMVTARQFQLTAYDAAYLHLALVRGIPLATSDGPLARVAASAGVRSIVD